MTVPVDYGLSLEEQCNQIWAATREAEARDKRTTQIPDVIKIWDGHWLLQHIVTCDLESKWEQVDGDTGAGSMTVPTLTHVGQWLMQMQERVDRGEGRNVHLTVETASGVRMGYRLEQAVQEDRDDGTSVVVSSWQSDYEFLKSITLRSMPFLPAWVQIPRAWVLPGPSIWAIKTSLMANLWRKNSPLLTFLDDPFLNGTVFNGNLDQAEWDIVIKPTSLQQDLQAGTPWCIVASRWDNFHDRVKPILKDAEITPVLTRWLAGDPPPWPGANLRHGTLVVDFVDVSGTYTGTSHGGNIFSGLLSTITNLVDDFVGSTIDLYTGATIPAEYYDPGSGSSRPNKRLPTTIWLAGENTGIVESKFAAVPGREIQIASGGKSMPGVNEGIEALISGGPGGSSIAALTRPLWEDTILAFGTVFLGHKAAQQGWNSLYEKFEGSPSAAYTLSYVMTLRAGAWVTRPYTSFTLKVRDGRPWVVGRHIWLGDRGGATKRHEHTGRIYIDRLTKITRKRSRSEWQNWDLTFGDERALRDPWEKLFDFTSSLAYGLEQLGLW